MIVTALDDAPNLKVAAAAGDEDTAIALDIAAALTDSDGSETLAVEIAGIPVGTTVSDGTNSFTAAPGSTRVDVSGWDLAALTIAPPADSDADFTLTVTAISTETENGDQASASKTLAVTIAAVADQPTLSVADAAGNQDSTIALDIAAALGDTDGSEALSLVITAIPLGATIGDGANSFTATAGNDSVDVAGWNLAALTITPPAGSGADFTLTVTAIATEAENGDSAELDAELDVAVLPALFTAGDDVIDFAGVTRAPMSRAASTTRGRRRP